MKNQAAIRVDYTVMYNALANAALSRRAALQVELAVGLIHFDQEDEGTEAGGKARLKETYRDAGYDCMTKADRDYITVNRRLNACAALYDKFGSKMVSGWVAKGLENGADTQNLIAYVITELAAYPLMTMDDVLHYVGKDSSKKRQPRQSSGPVTTTKAEASNEADAGTSVAQAPADRLDLEQVKTQILSQFAPELINQFCAELLEQVARMEATLKAA